MFADKCLCILQIFPKIPLSVASNTVFTFYSTRVVVLETRFLASFFSWLFCQLSQSYSNGKPELSWSNLASMDKINLRALADPYWLLLSGKVPMEGLRGLDTYLKVFRVIDWESLNSQKVFLKILTSIFNNGSTLEIIKAVFHPIPLTFSFFGISSAHVTFPKYLPT